FETPEVVRVGFVSQMRHFHCHELMMIERILRLVNRRHAAAVNWAANQKPSVQQRPWLQFRSKCRLNLLLVFRDILETGDFIERRFGFDANHWTITSRGVRSNTETRGRTCVAMAFPGAEITSVWHEALRTTCSTFVERNRQRR